MTFTPQLGRGTRQLSQTAAAWTSLLTAVPGDCVLSPQRGHQSHLRAGLEPSVGKKQSVPFPILTEKKEK